MFFTFIFSFQLNSWEVSIHPHAHRHAGQAVATRLALCASTCRILQGGEECEKALNVRPFAPKESKRPQNYGAIKIQRKTEVGLEEACVARGKVAAARLVFASERARDVFSVATAEVRALGPGAWG